MARIAIIGGSGADLFPVKFNTAKAPETKWGAASAALSEWSSDLHEIVFLPRHGVSGLIAPHAVNYRANIQLIHDFGADWVVALNAVGGIPAETAPGKLVIPDQLVDYTWGRAHSYYGDSADALKFIEFTEPYSSNLRSHLIVAANQAQVDFLPGGTYGATQGPRLETAAEIDRLERDGCQIVGMTAMPEAALARELDLEYASLALVVNRAAGRTSSDLHVEIDKFLSLGTTQAAQVIQALQRLL